MAYVYAIIMGVGRLAYFIIIEIVVFDWIVLFCIMLTN